MVEVDDYLMKIGNLGHYQWRLVCINFLLNLIIAQQMLGLIFLEYTPDYWCVDQYGNGTVQNQSHIQFSEDKCKYNIKENNITTIEKRCSNFAYDTTYFTSTVVTQSDLVCGKVKFLAIVRSLAMALSAIGSLVTSYISDKYGRRIVSIVGVFSCGIFGALMAASVSYEMYAIMKCLTNLIGFSSLVPMLSLVMESTALTKRAVVSTIPAYAWPVGAALLSLIGYLTDKWWHIALAISLPMLVVGVLVVWQVEESPHWLATENRREECMKVLTKIRDINEIETDLIFEASELDDNSNLDTKGAETETTEEEGLIKIFRHLRLFSRFLIMGYGWFAFALCYYILSFSVLTLPGNLYVNNAVMSLVEIIAYTYCFLMQCLGRKWPGVVAMLLSGAALLAAGLITLYAPDQGIAITAMSVIGKFSVAASWQIVFVWGSEIFPTNHRTKLVSYNRLGAEVGSAIAPVIYDLPRMIDVANEEIILPAVISLLMFVAAFLHMLFIPDSHNCQLPENMDAANAIRFVPKAEEETAEQENSDETEKFLDTSLTDPEKL